MHFVPSMAPQRRSADIAKEVADNIKTLGKGLLRSGTTWKAVSRRNVTVICMISRSRSGFLDTQLLPLPIVRLVAQFRYSEKPTSPAIEEKIESITHKYGLEPRWDLAFYLGSWKFFHLSSDTGGHPRFSQIESRYLSTGSSTSCLQDSRRSITIQRQRSREVAVQLQSFGRDWGGAGS